MPKKKTRSILELKKLDSSTVKWLIFQKTTQLRIRLGLLKKPSASEVAQIWERLEYLVKNSEKKNESAIQKSIRRNKEKQIKREKVQEKRKRKAQIEADAKFIKSKKFESEVGVMVDAVLRAVSTHLKNPEIKLYEQSAINAKEYVSRFKGRYLEHPDKNIRTLANKKYELVLKDKGIIK